MKKAHTKDYQKFLLEQLKEPEMATEYLKAAMEEKDDALLLLALRSVVESQNPTC